jgi:hypothetical protein
MLGLGLLGWIALIWIGSKVVPGMKSYGGTPVLGGETNQRDGTIAKLADGTPLLACAGKWWAIEPNGVCCQAASGTAITLSDGEQVVCALVTELASYRWVKPGSM